MWSLLIDGSGTAGKGWISGNGTTGFSIELVLVLELRVLLVQYQVIRTH
jgi:hypothetical protein